MPVSTIQTLFFSESLTWSYAANGNPSGIGTTEVNLDTNSTRTGQAISEVFTITDPPQEQEDATWDQLVFTLEITHVNQSANTSDADIGRVHFRLYDSAGNMTRIPATALTIAAEDAPAGSYSGTYEITFENVPAGDYRLFAGETNKGDGEALNISVVNGTGSDVVCFAAGSLIAVPGGTVPVEELRQGDLVLTRDSGPQKIQWIGTRSLSRQALARHENLKPIRIAAGALGPNVPSADLTVSPQHRILVRSRIAQRMFGEAEVLCAAKHLLALPGIRIRQEPAPVSYTHFLLERHEIVYANGAETESLHTGPMALKALEPAQRNELLSLFPELMSIDHRARSCRHLVTGKDGRKLAFRHCKNNKPLVPEPHLAGLPSGNRGTGARQSPPAA